ncbi:MAG: hypothetical protein MUF34_32245 [Polyangiaceae bacterium]|nr:hypothetical protein [Polyangiaceae bacterium]
MRQPARAIRWQLTMGHVMVLQAHLHTLIPLWLALIGWALLAAATARFNARYLELGPAPPLRKPNRYRW